MLVKYVKISYMLLREQEKKIEKREREEREREREREGRKYRFNR